MKTIAKLALGALMLAGAATTVSEPAAAGVSVGIGIGIPGPAYYPGYYGPRRVCDPYSRWYDPYYCGAADAYYDGPVFIGGGWYNGPFRWRYWGGQRQFWWNGGWHAGTGFHPGGFHGHVTTAPHGGFGGHGSFGGHFGHH